MNKHLKYLWYDQKVNALNFIHAWKDFSKEITDNVYDDSSALTEYVLGKQNGYIKVVEDTRLYYHLERSLGIELKPYREDKFCDVSLYSKNQFDKIYSLLCKPEDRKDNKKWALV